MIRSRTVLGPGWLLRPGETHSQTETFAIGDAERNSHIMLDAGAYKVTIYDLGLYGYPTVCEPARLDVVER